MISKQTPHCLRMFVDGENKLNGLVSLVATITCCMWESYCAYIKTKRKDYSFTLLAKRCLMWNVYRKRSTGQGTNHLNIIETRGPSQKLNNVTFTEPTPRFHEAPSKFRSCRVFQRHKPKKLITPIKIDLKLPVLNQINKNRGVKKALVLSRGIQSDY